MMEKLMARAEQIAQQAQQRRIQQIAQELRAIFGSTSIDVQEAQVLVGGKGLIKRWLFDPRLRFLARGQK
jgi:hypothetical protein